MKRDEIFWLSFILLAAFTWGFSLFVLKNYVVVAAISLGTFIIIGVAWGIAMGSTSSNKKYSEEK